MLRTDASFRLYPGYTALALKIERDPVRKGLRWVAEEVNLDYRACPSSGKYRSNISRVHTVRFQSRYKVDQGPAAKIQLSVSQIIDIGLKF